MPAAAALDVACVHCHNKFQIKTMLAHCPHCNMVYAVTPCHSHRVENVMPAGIGY